MSVKNARPVEDELTNRRVHLLIDGEDVQGTMVRFDCPLYHVLFDNGEKHAFYQKEIRHMLLPEDNDSAAPAHAPESTAPPLGALPAGLLPSLAVPSLPSLAAPAEFPKTNAEAKKASTTAAPRPSSKAKVGGLIRASNVAADDYGNDDEQSSDADVEDSDAALTPEQSRQIRRKALKTEKKALLSKLIDPHNVYPATHVKLYRIAPRSGDLIFGTKKQVIDWVQEAALLYHGYQGALALEYFKQSNEGMTVQACPDQCCLHTVGIFNYYNAEICKYQYLTERAGYEESNLTKDILSLHTWLIVMPNGVDHSPYCRWMGLNAHRTRRLHPLPIGEKTVETILSNCLEYKHFNLVQMRADAGKLLQIFQNMKLVPKDVDRALKLGIVNAKRNRAAMERIDPKVSAPSVRKLEEKISKKAKYEFLNEDLRVYVENCQNKRELAAKTQAETSDEAVEGSEDEDDVMLSDLPPLLSAVVVKLPPPLSPDQLAKAIEGSSGSAARDSEEAFAEGGCEESMPLSALLPAPPSSFPGAAGSSPPHPEAAQQEVKAKKTLKAAVAPSLLAVADHPAQANKTVKTKALKEHYVSATMHEGPQPHQAQPKKEDHFNIDKRAAEVEKRTSDTCSLPALTSVVPKSTVMPPTPPSTNASSGLGVSMPSDSTTFDSGSCMSYRCIVNSFSSGPIIGVAEQDVPSIPLMPNAAPPLGATSSFAVSLPSPMTTCSLQAVMEPCASATTSREHVINFITTASDIATEQFIDAANEKPYVQVVEQLLPNVPIVTPTISPVEVSSPMDTATEGAAADEVITDTTHYGGNARSSSADVGRTQVELLRRVGKVKRREYTRRQQPPPSVQHALIPAALPDESDSEHSQHSLVSLEPGVIGKTSVGFGEGVLGGKRAAAVDDVEESMITGATDLIDLSHPRDRRISVDMTQRADLDEDIAASMVRGIFHGKLVVARTTVSSSDPRNDGQQNSSESLQQRKVGGGARSKRGNPFGPKRSRVGSAHQAVIPVLEHVKEGLVWDPSVCSEGTVVSLLQRLRADHAVAHRPCSGDICILKYSHEDRVSRSKFTLAQRALVTITITLLDGETMAMVFDGEDELTVNISQLLPLCSLPEDLLLDHSIATNGSGRGHSLPAFDSDPLQRSYCSSNNGEGEVERWTATELRMFCTAIKRFDNDVRKVWKQHFSEYRSLPQVVDFYYRTFCPFMSKGDNSDKVLKVFEKADLLRNCS